MSFLIENILKNTNEKQFSTVNNTNNVKSSGNAHVVSTTNDLDVNNKTSDVETNSNNKTICNPLKNTVNCVPQTLICEQDNRIVHSKCINDFVIPITPKPCYYKRNNIFDSFYYSPMDYYYASLQHFNPYGGLFNTQKSLPDRDYPNNILNLSMYRNQRLNTLDPTRYLKSYKRKGGQIRFTPYQTEELEKKFSSNKYLSPDDRKEIAELLSLSDRQVKTWFQNRRAKWRRNHQSSEHYLGESIGEHEDEDFIIEVQ